MEQVTDNGDIDNDVVEEPTEESPAEESPAEESPAEEVETDAPIGHPEGYSDPNEKDDAPIAEPG